jgi:hypothetical protein
MAKANPLWGAPRIHGALLKLGITEVKTYTTKPVTKSILQAFNWKHSQGLPQSSNRIECQPFKVNNF